jgi:hypothetical protein
VSQAAKGNQQFTVVPRNPSTPVEHTKASLERLIAGVVPEMRILRVNPSTGVVTAEIPEQHVDQVRSALGEGFLVDRNAFLNLQNV